MEDETLRRSRRRSVAQEGQARQRRIIKGCLIALVVFALLCGGVAYGYLRYLNNLMAPGGKKPASAAGVLNQESGGPVNILVLGIDRRDNEPARSDTNIIVRVDTAKKRAVMVSIPRDFRVEIPGRGLDKINAAAAYGGPSLAIKTITKFTGMKINHYVALDHAGFREMIDAIGGVSVYMKEPMGAPGTDFYITAGWHHFNGRSALDFVRFRHDPQGDLGRIERQQRLIGALFDEALSYKSMFKIPSLINAFARNTESDLTATQLLYYGNLLRSMDKKDLETVTLPGSNARIDGIAYLIPQMDQIKVIINAVKSGRSLSFLKAAIPNSDIRVRVLNGTDISGLALRVAGRLDAAGFAISDTDNAEKRFSRTFVRYGAGDYQKALKVAEKLRTTIVRYSEKVTAKADVEVVVGKDYKKSLKGSE